MLAMNVRSRGSRSVPANFQQGSMPKRTTPARTNAPIVPIDARKARGCRKAR